VSDGHVAPTGKGEVCVRFNC